MSDKIVTHIEGLEKAKAFCAYQERCHKEVIDKLKTWKLTEDEIDFIVGHLLDENYLNEERFAMAFVSGKFRIKHWGKKKIIQKLKEKNISEYCIKKGLLEIDEADYYATLSNVVDKKFHSLKDKNIFTKKKKTAAYAYGRGFETDLIWDYINSNY